MQFEKINVNQNREKLIKFRKDSFQVSFENTDDFGDESVYLNWLAEKTMLFPEGLVFVKEADKVIGQLELTIREFEGRKIGYVHLYYLIPDMRGEGRGSMLHQYAKSFFTKNKVNEFHLRVAPENHVAINFYKKIGMEEVGPELGGKVIRMRGYL
ncbi:GNAT family N-acetyltransferase [Oceanobacillus sp. FSL H7-0719]|uniref:GNAT family N-acetyltransferase n=1 Tax=Oceanobacillus sp. FSL H7-0719 TaxID=2954507 RepID=UPI00324DD356